jgi:hypothetical protein
MEIFNFKIMTDPEWRLLHTMMILRKATQMGMDLLLEQVVTGMVFVPRVFSGLIGEIFTSRHIE